MPCIGSTLADESVTLGNVTGGDVVDGITVGEGVGVMVGLCGNTIVEDITERKDCARSRVRWRKTSLIWVSQISCDRFQHICSILCSCCIGVSKNSTHLIILIKLRRVPRCGDPY